MNAEDYLPEARWCFYRIKGQGGKVVAVYEHTPGYFPIDLPPMATDEADQWVDNANEQLGLTREQAMEIVGCSMFVAQQAPPEEPEPPDPAEPHITASLVDHCAESGKRMPPELRTRLLAHYGLDEPDDARAKLEQLRDEAPRGKAVAGLHVVLLTMLANDEPIRQDAIEAIDRWLDRIGELS